LYRRTVPSRGLDMTTTKLLPLLRVPLSSVEQARLP
jgi:hypothetical protein